MRHKLLLLALVTLVVLGGFVLLLTQPLVAPLKSDPPAIDAARLRETVRRLSVDLHPRSFEHAATLISAGRYIADAFEAVGAKPEIQSVNVQGEKYFNVVARFGPTDGSVTVVGAHYDTHADTPGADDNASGVAGLVELARLLAAHPPTRPVQLVAYTLEEPPHFRTGDMGSAHHAMALRQSGRAIDLMISLEMIGYFSDEADSQSFPVPVLNWLYPTTGNFIAIVARPQDFTHTRQLKAAMLGATDLPVHSINAFPFMPGIDFSDHLSYWAEGFHAVMVTDTAFNRNREYHLAGDTHDRLDYARMAKVVQGVHAFVVRPQNE